MSRSAITVSNLAKQYQIGLSEAARATFRDVLVDVLKTPVRRFRQLSGQTAANGQGDSTFWALRDVSFEVRPGEVIGIVGRNGAGKSTLLKILSRVTEPTEGEVHMRGRVGSLLEVGTGFHPELTGRENIYLNGSILGMKKTEIQRKFDEIVEFSGVSKFLDTQVKHYSSGMQVRLGFAVAAHLEPEILIVDEVLAVGDAEFQRKCMAKMQDVARTEGRTILFVSHNMGAMRTLCTVGIYLNQGRLVQVGPIEDIVNHYLSTLTVMGQVSLSERIDRDGKGNVRLLEFSLIDANDQPCNTVFTGSPCMVVFRYEANQPVRNPVFQFAVYNSTGEVLMHFSSDLTPEPLTSLPRAGTVSCRIDRLPLAPGAYRVNTAIYDIHGMQDRLVGTMHFDVAWGDYHRLGRNYELRKNTCVAEGNWGFDEKSDLA